MTIREFIKSIACSICKSLGGDDGSDNQAIKQLQTTIIELQADINDLLSQLALGMEKPSWADIVTQDGILVDNSRQVITIDLHRLNIPFLFAPQALPIMEIPDTGSMDGIFDYGNNNLYIKPTNPYDHSVMVDWIAQQWRDSQGLNTVDVVYRIMENEADDPGDFTKLDKWYAIHRLVEVGTDEQGRYFWFAGVNNLYRDPFKARDKNILWLNIGTIA